MDEVAKSSQTINLPKPMLYTWIWQEQPLKFNRKNSTIAQKNVAHFDFMVSQMKKNCYNFYMWKF